MADKNSETRSPKSPLEHQVGGDHYKSMDIQPVEFALVNNLNTAQANIVKYLLRDKSADDIDKAIHYLDLWLEIAARYGYALGQLAPPLYGRAGRGFPVITVEYFSKCNKLSDKITQILSLVIDEPTSASLGAARYFMEELPKVGPRSQ